MSDSFWPHVLQHFRLPCPSLSPRVCSNSCPWVSVAIQLSHPLMPTSPPAFNLSEHHGLFQWVSASLQGAKFTGVSASVFPMNIQGWFPLGLTGLISTLFKGFSAFQIRSDQIRSVAQLCPTLCDPMNCSTPGLPVHHQLPEFTETHVHRVSDAIQPSHPLSSPFPLAPNPSQHQSLFQWVNSSHEVPLGRFKMRSHKDGLKDTM